MADWLRRSQGAVNERLSFKYKYLLHDRFNGKQLRDFSGIFNILISPIFARCFLRFLCTLIRYFMFVLLLLYVCVHLYMHISFFHFRSRLIPSFTNTQLSDTKVGGATVYPKLKVRLPPVQVQVDWHTVEAV